MAEKVNKGMIDAELIYDNKATKEDLQKMEPVNRTVLIFEIKAREVLAPSEEGIELNEGYDYEINGSIPQLADGIAKLLIEMDKDQDLGENGGYGFLNLITEYYKKLKSE